MMSEPEKFDTAPVHTSLQRRPSMGGLPQDAFLLIALIMVSMVIASRLDPLVLAGCVGIYLLLLPILRRLFEKEPFLMEIVPRALRYEARYDRQSTELSKPWRDRVSLRFIR